MLLSVILLFAGRAFTFWCSRGYLSARRHPPVENDHGDSHAAAIYEAVTHFSATGE
jgi:hypothetical protein